MGRRDMNKPAIILAVLATIELYRVVGYVRPATQQAVEGTKHDLLIPRAFRIDMPRGRRP